MKKGIIFTLFIVTLKSPMLYAQLLNGVWTGNYSKKFFGNPKSLIIEISVFNDSIVKGSSHLHYNNKNYEHHIIDGIYNKNDSTIRFSETLIETTHSAYEVFYLMKLEQTDSSYKLVGKWRPKNSNLKYLSNFNKVWLSKSKKLDTERVKQNLKVSPIEKIEKVIEISDNEKDSIKISVYDNGIVDNDSISVFFNDSVIIYNKQISEKPIEVYLTLWHGKQFQKLKMVANNLGTIPPNTALLIITTRLKRYEINLNSDFRNSGVVEFMLIE